MASLEDIGVAAGINSLSVLVFLLAYSILRLQPINDRIYFPKWYLKGIRASPVSSGTVRKIVNLDPRMYLRFWNWMPAALQMPEPEIIDHAGLDSAVYIRIYLLGLKIFVPITALAFVVLVPVNWTNDTLVKLKDVTFSDIDKLSISNVPPGSSRFWVHLGMAYVFSFWTWYKLYKEYQIVATMRLQFLASESRRPDQYTVSLLAFVLDLVCMLYCECDFIRLLFLLLVCIWARSKISVSETVPWACINVVEVITLRKVLVKNVPLDPDESVSEHVDHFFCVNHADHYLTHQVVYNANRLATLVENKKSLHNWLTYYQNKYERNSSNKPTVKTGFWGLWGQRVDAIDYYTAEIDKLSEEEDAEREKVISDPKAVIPAAFVSFKSRWGAAVCAQTQQSRNPTIWLTEWAPEPRDVYWRNLAVPYVELSVRRLLMAVALFFLVFFFMIPIAIVQSFANIEGIEKVLPFLKPVIEAKTIKSFIQGFLPGIALKIFLIILPTILMIMSKIEGYTSLSSLERKSASKYHKFILVNVFLGSIVTGTALQQLHQFLHQSPAEIPKTIGVSIPMKATFFISYIMVDGWSGIAAEILRLVPFVIFHLKNTFLVKTEKDREEAMDPGSLAFSITEPRLQLYFLLGLVYAPVSPILLPFIIVFFAFAYVVFRHQVINVYDQKYESGASFWPDVHRRILIGQVISQLLLLGLLSTKEAARMTPFLIALPLLTIWFHLFCKGRFKSAFLKLPLQDAVIKDTLERATEPDLNLKVYLEDAYIHPIFKGGEYRRPNIDEESDPIIVATKRNSQMGSKTGSSQSSQKLSPR